MRVRNLTTIIVICAAAGGVGLFGGASSARGELVRVYDWDYFTGGAGSEKLLDNNKDFTDNSAVPVDRNYHFGFSLDEIGGERICGYANNNNFKIQSVKGKYIDMLFGQKPTGMMVNHDLTGDGIGDYDTITGKLFLDGTDDIYVAGNFFGWLQGILYGGRVIGGIELDGTLNDISALPSWPGVSTPGAYLPRINLVDIPEPATLGLITLGGLGLIARKRKK